jgi:hypothetical protein
MSGKIQFFDTDMPPSIRIEVEKLFFSKDSVDIVTITDVKLFFEQFSKITFVDKEGQVEFVKVVRQ